MPTNFQTTVKSLIYAAICSYLLSSCSSTDHKSRSSTKSPATVIEQTTSPKVSAQYYLTQAKTASPEVALSSLVSASEEFLLSADYHQALWLANQTSALLADFQQESKPHYRLLLVKSASLHALGHNLLAREQLDLADNITQQNNLKHQANYYHLKSIIAVSQGLIVNAIDDQLNAFALDDNAGELDIFSLWQSLTQLSQWQIKQLQLKSPPYFSGWQKLLTYAHKYGDQHEKFIGYLAQWQLSFPNHPANMIIPSLKIKTDINIETIKNIAIILPLSGPQMEAGKTAQQGILSAYQELNNNQQLHFIDSNLLDITTLADTFTVKTIDFVIGPLLKADVESYLQHDELTIPTLLLNVPNELTLPAHNFALSMRREDEAIQAATSLSQREYNHPIILSDKSAVSARIAQTFAEQWKVMKGTSPEIIYFEPGEQMQNDLKASLDISASDERIDELKSRLKQSIKTESRNRRDIDMIYLVGSAKQTKLLKPYIDVNTSPFSKIIPVYASSLSHSYKDDSSENNDLNDLVFTEIPWLLNSKQQNRNLAKMSRKIWPQRTDSLERIFAMGYDSLSLVNKIPVMQQKSYIRHFGQTGVLQLNDNNILTRSLIWGRYRNSTVQEITID